jgi:hypothetical protein
MAIDLWRGIPKSLAVTRTRGPTSCLAVNAGDVILQLCESSPAVGDDPGRTAADRLKRRQPIAIGGMTTGRRSFDALIQTHKRSKSYGH